ncbi:MAG: ROK family transcriptional regulator [Clostridiales bacterium]|nr:ROK family transcriptional regulator [Clostridiales bacterium]
MAKNGKMVTGNPELIRKMNRSLIIKTIMENESISRSQLEVRTSLALPTIMRIVSDLIDEGLVAEVGKGDSSGGRRPVMLRMNTDGMYFIGAGVQRLFHVVLADISGNIIARHNCEMKFDTSSEIFLNQVTEGIDSVVAQSGIDAKKIRFAGIGIPATEFKYDYKGGLFLFDVWVDSAPEDWKGSGKMPCPVLFENNATLGALGELSFGLAKNSNNCIYIAADHGVGSGIVIDGKLFTGTDGVAGEFGHTVVKADGLSCYCGNKGCLEMYCSTSAIINRLLKDKNADPALKAQLAENPDFLLLKSAAYNGDNTAFKYIKESARILGIGIAGLINMFNPDMVIVGGELPESCPGYMDIVAQSAKSGIFRKSASEVDILESGLKSDAIVRGAVALAMAQVFDHI